MHLSDQSGEDPGWVRFEDPELLASGAFVKGWAGIEGGQRWALGSTTILRLKVAGDVGVGLVVSFAVEPLVAPGICKQQVVDLCVNGCFLTRFYVRSHGTQNVYVPAGLILDGEITIDLHNVTAFRPVETGKSTDSRLLSLRFERFRIKPVKRELGDAAAVNLIEFDDPSFVPSGSGQDMSGKLFVRGIFYYRVISEQADEFFRELVNERILERAAQLDYIPAQLIVAIAAPTRRIVFITRASPWAAQAINMPLEGIKEAARVWIGLSLLLFRRRPDTLVGLVDGHYGNFVLFSDGRPRWVDIGSIMPIGNAFGLDQFTRCIVYPLVLIASKREKASVIREMMEKRPEGISHEEFERYAGREMLLDNRGPFTKSKYRSTLERLQRVIDKLQFEETSFWSNYRNEDELNSALIRERVGRYRDKRFAKIGEIADELNFESFLDVGANDGVFSLIVRSRKEAVGLAVDLDEHALNKLFRFIYLRKHLRISAARLGFHEIRFKADLVLALAITHHLTLGQGMTFDCVASRLSEMTKKYLITEFMPDGLGGNATHPEPLPNPLPEFYGIDNFVRSLRKYFAKVSVVDYNREEAPSRRTLIVCERS